MKTTIIRILNKAFRGAAIISLSISGLVNGTAYAQGSDESDKAALQASVFPSQDPLVLKIVFVNPAKEKVDLLVRNSEGEIIYKRLLSDTEQYNSKYAVWQLPDGKYTFEVKSARQHFSQPFVISTQTARLTYVH